MNFDHVIDKFGTYMHSVPENNSDAFIKTKLCSLRRISTKIKEDIQMDPSVLFASRNEDCLFKAQRMIKKYCELESKKNSFEKTTAKSDLHHIDGMLRYHYDGNHPLTKFFKLARVNIQLPNKHSYRT